MEKIELELEVDNPNEMRPALIETPNALEEAHLPTEEEIVEMFDKVYDDIS